jgi:hypothetical protein
MGLWPSKDVVKHIWWDFWQSKAMGIILGYSQMPMKSKTGSFWYLLSIKCGCHYTNLCQK